MMQEIHVKDNRCTNTNDPLSKEFVLKEVATERSIINVSVSVESCSCDTILLNSEYITSKENITYGEASSEVDRSFELAISSLKQKKKATIFIEIAGKLIHDSLCENTINLRCELMYIIVMPGKNIYSYSDAEKLYICKRYKELAICKLGESTADEGSSGYPLRLSVFLLLVRALKWLSIISIKNLLQDEVTIYNTLKIQCYNNISYFHLEFGNYKKAVLGSTIVLNSVPNNTKALYRRAVGNTNLQNYELAYTDLKLVLEMEPSNSSAKRQMAIVSKHIKSLDKIYADAMKKYLSFK